MYIKEIKLSGFKSFADKVSLNLDSNFTGIVGPNGSGKSNIVDAIKWVLGEQSLKSLRGSENMADVIFAGSSVRTPSVRASVCITFDNTDHALKVDYEEVSIKRCVYKSGENEYYLNNERCRLKDITNLFLDDFNSKDAFNIIPQGKIEQIISSNPEARRVIIEEASGVLKYKNRKEDALKKLAKTDDNISRVDLILDELKSQLEPLKMASDKALEYKKIKDTLEKYEVSIIVKDITKANADYSIKNKEKEEKENLLTNYQTIYSKDNVNVIKLKEELSELENKKEELSSVIESNNEKLGQLNEKMILLKERSKYNNTSDEVKNNIVLLKEKELSTKNNLTVMNEELGVIKEKYESIKSNIDKLNNDYTLINKRKIEFSNEYQRLTNIKNEITHKIDIIDKSELNLESVPYSVKEVLSRKQYLGVIDRVGALITSEEKYANAIETALGFASNFIVTKDVESAKESIKYLKDNNKGRATFYPLTVIKPKSINPSLLNDIKNDKGYIDLASSLVKYDFEYYNIISNILGNVIVVDDINNATLIAKKIDYKYRIVTLSGDIVNVGGSLTGGGQSDKNKSFKLQKINLNNSLEKVLYEINTYSNKVKDLNNEEAIVNTNMNKFTIECTKYEEELRIKSVSYEQTNAEYKKICEEIATLNSDKENIDKEADTLLKAYYELQGTHNIDKNNLNVLVDKINDIKENIVIDEKNIKSNLSQINQLSTEINAINVDTVKINYTLDNLLNRLNEEYSLTYDRALTLYEVDDLVEEHRDEVNDLKKKIKNLGDVNLSSIDEYERINTRYTYLSTQREDLKQSENDLLEIINNLDKTMSYKFKATFDRLNVEFDRVFKDLFSGGEARLIMTEPQDVLTTGIEIEAIPKGKTLKSMSLLSGGEKSLTAVSLIFSIMNLKKVPFVVFDEVESALDDANVAKFGEYLENYRGKTQLLIITHKKKTMEFADVLYGVTMQEAGISKLVSVKLEDVK